MTRKLLGTFTTVVAALTVVGVAWAGSGPGAEVEVAAEVAADAGIATDATTASTAGPSSSSVTSGGSSSTSITAGGGSSTGITSGGGSSSSSTIDDDDKVELIVSAGGSFAVPGVGTVTVDIREGRLVLTDVSAPTWGIDVEELEPDEIRIDFHKGDAEARFEAGLEDGLLEIEIRTN